MTTRRSKRTSRPTSSATPPVMPTLTRRCDQSQLKEDCDFRSQWRLCRRPSSPLPYPCHGLSDTENSPDSISTTSTFSPSRSASVTSTRSGWNTFPWRATSSPLSRMVAARSSCSKTSQARSPGCNAGEEKVRRYSQIVSSTHRARRQFRPTAGSSMRPARIRSRWTSPGTCAGMARRMSAPASSRGPRGCPRCPSRQRSSQVPLSAVVLITVRSPSSSICQRRLTCGVDRRPGSTLLRFCTI